eukprot:6106647-Amphidinium_carterae.1
MMNKELIEPLTPDMPELMSVQPERRYHGFRMCKAHLISEDRLNEVTANAKRQKEEEDSIKAMKEQAEGKILQCTVEAVARLPDTTVRPQEEQDNEDEEEDDDEETGTVAEGMSPKNYLEVDEMATDPLTIPHLSEALKTLGEFDQEMEKATRDAKKMIEEYEGLAASVSAAASSKSRVRTLRLTAKKTKKAGSKKKAKGNVVKLDPTALSAIDEVAS